ncbi:MAG: hypothetical protein PHS59_03285 [Paludibacter sp.]|nr:hypothetical protein [Paludibacter sp.]
MDYREQLARPLSKHFVDIIVYEVLSHPDDFNLVYQLIFDVDKKVAWRAAWACQKISEKKPEWFTEKHFNELADRCISTKHGGLQRACLSILYNIEMPDSIPVLLINSCFEWMVSPRYPIAVQAYSMKLLYRICLKEPDFIPELKAYLENMHPEDYSAGFISSRKNTLNLLNNIKFN